MSTRIIIKNVEDFDAVMDFQTKVEALVFARLYSELDMIKWVDVVMYDIRFEVFGTVLRFIDGKATRFENQ